MKVMSEFSVHEPVMEHLSRKLERTADALCMNRMDAHCCQTKEEALALVKSLLRKDAVVSVGGSMTLKECGVMELLRSGDYQFLDREAVAPEEQQDLYRKAFTADYFLCSSNAITENGELYNVDGVGNRVSALIYGPKEVIVVAGANKIVSNLDAAAERVKKLAAPVNAIRLSQETPCARIGACSGMKGDMAAGCHCEQRICCSYVVSGYQRFPNRIHVILVAENLGY